MGLGGDLSPAAASAPPALSPQPGKLTEAFKYFLQGMGYSECQGWAQGWPGRVRAHACACVCSPCRRRAWHPRVPCRRAARASVALHVWLHKVPVRVLGVWSTQALRVPGLCVCVCRCVSRVSMGVFLHVCMWMREQGLCLHKGVESSCACVCVQVHVHTYRSVRTHLWGQAGTPGPTEPPAWLTFFLCPPCPCPAPPVAHLKDRRLSGGTGTAQCCSARAHHCMVPSWP